MPLAAPPSSSTVPAARPWAPRSNQPLWQALFHAGPAVSDADLAQRIVARIQAGASVDQPLRCPDLPRSHKGWAWENASPLVGALAAQRPLTAQALLEHGANPQAHNDRIGCAINAAAHGCPSAIPALLAAGAHPDGNLHARIADRQAPLCAPAVGDDLTAMAALFAAGADLQAGWVGNQVLAEKLVARKQWGALCCLLIQPEGRGLDRQSPSKMVDPGTTDHVEAQILTTTFWAASTLRIENRNRRARPFTVGDVLDRLLVEMPQVPGILASRWAHEPEPSGTPEGPPSTSERWLDTMVRHHLGLVQGFTPPLKKRLRELVEASSMQGPSGPGEAWAAFAQIPLKQKALRVTLQDTIDARQEPLASVRPRARL